MNVPIHFEGTCDVCGAPIELDHDPETDGVIDHDITEDGRHITWMRHYATAPEGASPDCARYSSVVIAVPVAELPPPKPEFSSGMRAAQQAQDETAAGEWDE